MLGQAIFLRDSDLDLDCLLSRVLFSQRGKDTYALCEEMKKKTSC